MWSGLTWRAVEQWNTTTFCFVLTEHDCHVPLALEDIDCCDANYLREMFFGIRQPAPRADWLCFPERPEAVNKSNIGWHARAFHCLRVEWKRTCSPRSHRWPTLGAPWTGAESRNSATQVFDLFIFLFFFSTFICPVPGGGAGRGGGGTAGARPREKKPI